MDLHFVLNTAKEAADPAEIARQIWDLRAQWVSAGGTVIAAGAAIYAGYFARKAWLSQVTQEKAASYQLGIAQQQHDKFLAAAERERRSLGPLFVPADISNHMHLKDRDKKSILIGPMGNGPFARQCATKGIVVFANKRPANVIHGIRLLNKGDANSYNAEIQLEDRTSEEGITQFMILTFALPRPDAMIDVHFINIDLVIGVEMQAGLLDVQKYNVLVGGTSHRFIGAESACMSPKGIDLLTLEDV